MLLAAFVLAAAQAAPPPVPPTPAAPPRPTVADLAWMAGHWTGGEGGDLSEEVWTEPAGDAMLGMWRWVSKGQVKVLELLSLASTADGVVLRLRHFDANLVGWAREKDGPLTLRLVRLEPRHAVFEGQEEKGTVRITYRRPSDDVLLSTLKTPTLESSFEFRRH